MTASTRQKSEDVIINAPMSFAGAAQRAFRVRRKIKTPVLGTVLAVLLTAVWWIFVLCWYVFFGILLIPYRILRRGARKRKQEAIRHREVMAALERDRQAKEG